MEVANIIHLLPDSVANQIAAGEVIQRPASVVKELVENSIYAGASAVQIVIKDAGRTLIQVIDNGCGMSVTDARMAFERHATSKIQQATDLFSLHTMGFRGEALPSIAAVSEIEMRTMRAGDSAGTRIIINASRVEKQEPDMCSLGTNIMVKRIFFNLPARRKFLKKDAVEFAHIMREFERLALVNTNVAFTLVHNDAVMKQLPPATLKQRICDLFGATLEHQLIPVSTETSLVRIDGYVSLPQHARKRAPLQYFFVNGRNMRHPYFHKAVLGCYDNLISTDSQPCYFINFDVNPETIDVNIHPQKHEIKFENEQPIWQILSAAIKESLGRFNASSAIDFDTVDAPDIPAFTPDAAARMPDTGIDPNYNPFEQERQCYDSRYTPSAPASPAPRQTAPRPYAPTDWEKLYEGFASRKNESQEFTPPPIETEEAVDHPQLINDAPEVMPMFQLKGRYIVSPSKSGIMLIDQHRAHMRVLYERYMEMSAKGEIPSQRLIFPDSVTLDPSQNAIAMSVCELMCTMGFDISNLGGCDWAINAVPSMLQSVSPSAAFINIVSAISDAEEDVEQSQWQKIALAASRAAAIKYGTALTQEEMDRLVADLFRLSAPNYTPDNKLIISIIDQDEIQKRF